MPKNGEVRPGPGQQWCGRETAAQELKYDKQIYSRTIAMGRSDLSTNWAPFRKEDTHKKGDFLAKDPGQGSVDGKLLRGQEISCSTEQDSC